KFLAEHALGFKPKSHFSDVEVDRKLRPIEYGYAPTAEAAGPGGWPDVIGEHIKHWATHERAREYARDDIVYTRALDAHFGYPPANDDDSVLACAVASIRWHGFAINIEGIKALRAKADELIRTAPVNVNKPSEIRRYLMEVMDETEALVLELSTDKKTLKAITKWEGHKAAERAAHI